MAQSLRSSPWSDRPAPRPVISATGRPSRTQATAEEVVVLPMPISPVAMRPAPRSFSSRTSSTPVRTACSASPRAMAGPWVISWVPLPILRSSTPGIRPESRIPMSTGTTSQLATWAILHTEERLAPALRATAAVTV